MHMHCLYFMNVFVAILYSTTLERSAVEFAVDYINQRQLLLDPLYWSSTIDVGEIADNETARREMGNLDITS